MKKITLLFFCLLFQFSFCNAQLQGMFTIGGYGNDGGSTIIQTKDGNYAIVGATGSYGFGYSDVYFIKLDSSGDLIGTKTIGGLQPDGGNAMVQTKDGGFAIAGVTESYSAGYGDVYIIKLDSSGNLKWTRTVGGPGYDEGYSIVQTKDGGYAITGMTNSFGDPIGDVYIIKLDSIGNLKWTRTVGGKKYDVGYSIIQTKDDGYAVVGTTASFGAGSSSIYLIKLDSLGNLKLTETIGGPVGEEGYAIIQTIDGGYAITGATSSYAIGEPCVYLVKLDSMFHLQWTRAIGDSIDNAIGYSIIQTKDGGYIITGLSGLNAYVMKVNTTRNLEWTKNIGGITKGGLNGSGCSIIQRKDGGYALTGNTSSWGIGDNDVLVIMLDSTTDTLCTMPINKISRIDSGGSITTIDSGKVGSGGSITTIDSGRVSSGGNESFCIPLSTNKINPIVNDINIYPNPANSKLFIDMQNMKGNSILTLYDISGKELLTQTENETPLISFDVSAYTAGIYILKIQTEDGTTLVRKVAIAR